MFIPNPYDTDVYPKYDFGRMLSWKRSLGNYPVICVCGSTRFREEIYLAYEKLTRAGWIVVGVCPVMRDGDPELTEEEHRNIVDMHQQKMNMADAIYVVNKDGYIGASTRAEIIYAEEECMPVFYMEGDPYHAE